jgi:hypothetical protein
MRSAIAAPFNIRVASNEAFFTAGSDTMPHAFRIIDEGAFANDEADLAAGPMTL